jgi:hypothetical protein
MGGTIERDKPAAVIEPPVAAGHRVVAVLATDGAGRQVAILVVERGMPQVALSTV